MPLATTTAARYNITLEEGADFRRTVVILDEDDQPIDFSGWSTFAMQVNTKQDGGTVWNNGTKNINTTSGAITVTGSASSLEIVIESTELAGLTSYKYGWYTLRGNDAGGDTWRLLEGNVRFSRGTI